MAAPTISHLFQTIGDAIDRSTAVFVGDTITRVIDTITPWAAGGLIIYITLFGYLLLFGKIRAPAKAGLFKAVGIIIITSLALNADHYSSWVIENINGFQTSMTAAVTGQQGVNIYELLDGTLDEGGTLFATCTLKAADSGWSDLGGMATWLLIALLFMAAFFIVIVMGGAAIILASALLTVVFAVGPFFILCLLFPLTARWFNPWLSKILTYVFQAVMISAVMTVVVDVFKFTVELIDLNSQDAPNALTIGLGLIATGYILYLMVQKTAELASELGGAAAVELMGAASMAQAALMPGRAVQRATRATDNALTQLVNPVSRRLDPNTGRGITASRQEHLAMGRTVLNPAYRRAIQDMSSRNWRPPSRPTIESIAPSKPASPSASDLAKKIPPIPRKLAPPKPPTPPPIRR